MLSLMRTFSLTAVTLVGVTNLAKADDQLMEGVRSFVCDGGPIVLLKSDADWILNDEPQLKVRETRGGWRIGDQGFGFTTYLREHAGRGWVAEHLSSDGFEEWQCIEVTETTAKVVTAIKPRLAENIRETQELLAIANRELSTARAGYDISEREYQKRLTALEAENRLLLSDAADVEQHLDNLRASLLSGKPADIISAQLNALIALPPSERTERIEETSLGQKGLSLNTLVTVCIRKMRDKATMSSTCRQRLIDFISLEGL